MKKNLLKVSLLMAVAAVCFSCEEPNNPNIPDEKDDTTVTTPDKPDKDEDGDTTVTVSAPEMVLLVGGTFQMGSTDGDSDEEPVHGVTLSDFYIGKYEVTQAEYAAVMDTNPSYFKGDDLPVEQVSWYDAIEYCNALSIAEGLTPYYTIDKTTEDANNASIDDDVKWTVTSNTLSKGYRLPTEAEWEYAAKGGNESQDYTYSGSNTQADVAWYAENSNSTTHAVGTKAANELGLYDMSGNVWEWCLDWNDTYSSAAQTNPQGADAGEDRVVRGGSCNDSGNYCRSAYRSGGVASLGGSSLGFRVACSL